MVVSRQSPWLEKVRGARLHPQEENGHLPDCPYGGVLEGRNMPYPPDYTKHYQLL